MSRILLLIATLFLTASCGLPAALMDLSGESEQSLTGWGTRVWPSGGRYEGDFVNGLRHGRGTYVWPDGARYVGEFRQDQRTGQGVFTWPTGARYEGGFLNGKRHGPGVFIWPDGARFEGEYRYGRKHGQGTYYSADRSVVVCQLAPRAESQEWMDGRLVGSTPAISGPAYQPPPEGQAPAPLPPAPPEDLRPDAAAMLDGMARSPNSPFVPGALQTGANANQMNPASGTGSSPVAAALTGQRIAPPTAPAVGAGPSATVGMATGSGMVPGGMMPGAAPAAPPPVQVLDFTQRGAALSGQSASGAGPAAASGLDNGGREPAMPAAPPSAAAPSEPQNTRWREPRTAMEFQWVPAGCFSMGGLQGATDEAPPHPVCVDGFWMGRFEVTRAQWRTVMGASDGPATQTVISRRAGDRDDHPVETVSWADVQQFLGRLGFNSGSKFRLPTEAEWEYACRGGAAEQRFCGGDDPDRVAWFSANSGGRTHPVGGKAPNRFGLFDMSGNVWEWVSDWYAPGYYAQSPSRNPPGPAYGAAKVFRGGGWLSAPDYLRAGVRYRFEPTRRYNLLGFRVVRVLP